MRVLAYSTIRDYIKNHADADKPLRDWYNKVSRANWKSLADMRNDFNHVDFVGNDRYVFDIGGNSFRVVVVVIFLSHMVYIRFIGTHAEYDKISDIKNI